MLYPIEHQSEQAQRDLLQNLVSSLKREIEEAVGFTLWLHTGAAIPLALSTKMALPVIHKSTITSPSGKTISVEFCGEHHMGADHVEFIPSEPIAGVKRFFTTGGNALFNEADLCFYLYDSSLVVRVNSKSWRATYLANPDKKIRAELQKLRSKFYPEGRGCETQLKALKKCAWKAGLGEAFEGVFPSAWQPFVDKQKFLR